MEWRRVADRDDNGGVVETALMAPKHSWLSRRRSRRPTQLIMDGPPGVVVLFFTGDDIQCDSDEETLNEKTDEPVLLKIAMLRTRDVA